MFLQRPSEVFSERGLAGEGPGDHLSLQVPLLLLVLSCQASERLLSTQTLPWSESGSVSTRWFYFPPSFCNSGFQLSNKLGNGAFPNALGFSPLFFIRRISSLALQIREMVFDILDVMRSLMCQLGETEVIGPC